MPGADTLYRLYAPVFINAMGAVERGIAFVDNDRPGVMLLGAAERLCARHGVIVPGPVVLFGNHDRLYASAVRLLAAGAKITTIIDTRPPSECAQRAKLQALGVSCLSNHTVVSANGRPQLQAVRVAPRAGEDAGRDFACKTLLVSGGWSPAVQAGLQQGGIAAYEANVAGFVATDQPDWRLCCGAAGGQLTLRAILEDGRATAIEALRRTGRTSPSDTAAISVADADGDARLQPYWRSPASIGDEKRQFVDLQNDVTVADLRQTLEEGFNDIEHVKRYTTLGVGTEQGRTGGTLGAAILAELRGDELASVGISRSRGPYQPVPMMALSGLKVGAGLRPARRTPLHAEHVTAGAMLELMSGWMRPRYYAPNGADAFAASVVEARRVREHGGICDGSTLGKIEIAGGDAAAFVDSIYLSPPSTIEPGRSRYSILLREDGIVLDDGLMMRPDRDRFVATTSSSHTAHVLSHLEFYRDTAWAGRPIALSDVTEAWSVIIVAGPQSRTTLAAVLGNPWPQTLSAQRHMDVIDGSYSGASLRVMRASFSGELAFELHCEPTIASALWQSLVAAGLAPFGLEALDVLRVEKGYLTTSELNGQTTPADLRLERMLRAATDAVGKSMLDRPAFKEPERPILVGLRAIDGSAKFLGGAQLTRTDDPGKSVGYVTSAVFSPALGQWVGLALVARGLSEPATTLVARDPLRGGDTPVLITQPTHFDPTGERLRA